MSPGTLRIIPGLFLLCLLSRFAMPVEVAEAVPAAPVEHVLSQPDGSEFRARQWGDERVHGWETAEGYTIARDRVTGEWTYALRDGRGRMVPSSWVVGESPPPAGMARSLRPAATAPGGLSRTAPADAGSGRPAGVVPPSGSANIPVILVTFPDRSTTYSVSDFESLLFGTGVRSMKDYYEEVSYGAFTVSPGPSGIAGWFTAANGHDYYGANDGDGWDRWPGDLVYEAVAAADGTVDFSAYDSDGDCYVDVVGIVHQGTGEEVGESSADIWSHRWSLSNARYSGYSHYGVYTSGDSDPSCPGGYKVDDYIIMPELYRTAPYPLQSTIGVFTHEYGHALGLPDLYDTDGSSDGVGRWGLMGSGCWNYVGTAGDSPSHLSAWSKYFLGWVTPVEVTEELTGETIEAAAADVYRLLSGSPSSGGEYFLVENRQRAAGTFDVGLPGSGLAIWHIDDDKEDNRSECYPPSDCSVDHYRVSLVQADGRWDLEKGANNGDGGDLYPGSTDNRSFTGESTPASELYNGLRNVVAVTDISSSSHIMTATLAVYPDISVDPLLLDFGTVDPGKASPPQVVTIANSGRADLHIGSVGISGYSEGDFVIEADECANRTIPPHETCVVEVSFSPLSQGGKVAVLTVPSNDPDTPEVSVDLKGSAGGLGDRWDCFIATAAYGSYLHPHVQALRDFRDRWLLRDFAFEVAGARLVIPNVAGRAFVKAYYRYSPPVARYIAGHRGLRVLTRTALTPLVYGITYPARVIPAGMVVVLGVACSRMRKRRKVGR